MLYLTQPKPKQAASASETIPPERNRYHADFKLYSIARLFSPFSCGECCGGPCSSQRKRIWHSRKNATWKRKPLGAKGLAIASLLCAHYPASFCFLGFLLALFHLWKTRLFRLFQVRQAWGSPACWGSLRLQWFRWGKPLQLSTVITVILVWELLILIIDSQTFLAIMQTGNYCMGGTPPPNTHTHTHTRTHARTHARARAHTHTHTHTVHRDR